MYINESILRQIVRNSILKEAVFTANKAITPNTTTKYAGSKADVLVLSKSFKERVSKDYYVLVRWMGNKSPTKVFKKLPKEAWNTDVFAIFHDGSYDDNHKEKILNQDWLKKNIGKKVSEKYLEKLKKDWDNNKIAAVSTDFLQSDKEFISATESGGTWTDFALDTGIPAIAAISEMGAVLGIAPLKGVSDGANLIDAMRKMSKNDYLGCGLALMGLIPALGDSISVIGNGIKKLGTAAASRVAGQRVLKELIEVLGKVIDGDFIDTLKEIVYSFAEDRKMKPENTFANIKNALATFKGSLEFEIGKEKDAGQAIAHAAGITKKS